MSDHEPYGDECLLTEGEADNCPTCGLAACIGRFQGSDCDTDLFTPLTAPNLAAPKPRVCKRHRWRVNVATMEFECASCGRPFDDVLSKRGKNNRQRGNAIEREIGKKLGMKRVGQFGGKDDLSNPLFAAQVKSGGAFSERQWAWLKAVPVVAGQTQLLVVADTPGPGKKRRALVILDLDAWADLHAGSTE